MEGIGLLYSFSSHSYQPYVRYDTHLPQLKEAVKTVRILKRVLSESFRCLENIVDSILNFKETVDEGCEENIINWIPGGPCGVVSESLSILLPTVT